MTISGLSFAVESIIARVTSYTIYYCEYVRAAIGACWRSSTTIELLSARPPPPLPPPPSTIHSASMNLCRSAVAVRAKARSS